MHSLSRASQYAVRALSHLASGPVDSFILTDTLAGELDLPRAFLAKVLSQLAAHGHLETRRGRAGGVRLARPARSISLYDVVSSCEALDRRMACPLGRPTCGDDDGCPLHATWARLWDEALDALRSTDLESVALRDLTLSATHGQPADGGRGVDPRSADIAGPESG